MAAFISFEGPDGSGKSTQAKLCAESLRGRGYSVTDTREPGGTLLGEHVRDLILDPSSPPATALVMALLYSASRAQLVETVIRPALERGDVVVVDRWADSTVAYQGYGLGVDLDVLRELRAIATGGIEPDITILVDIEPQVGLRRTDSRGSPDRLDSRDLEFHRRVHDAYAKMLSENPRRWARVDGDGPREAVHCNIMESLLPRLQELQ